MPLPSPDEIVALYKKHGIKAVTFSWDRSPECMCPMSLAACDKLGDGDIEKGNKELNSKTSITLQSCVWKGQPQVVAEALGVDKGSVLKFLSGYDQQFVTEAEENAIGREARKLLHDEGLMASPVRRSVTKW